MCVDFWIVFTTNWLNYYMYNRMATRPPTTFVTWGMPLTSCITMFPSCSLTWWKYSTSLLSLQWMEDLCAILYTSKTRYSLTYVVFSYSKRGNAHLWAGLIFFSSTNCHSLSKVVAKDVAPFLPCWVFFSIKIENCKKRFKMYAISLACKIYWPTCK